MATEDPVEKTDTKLEEPGSYSCAYIHQATSTKNTPSYVII